MHIYLLLLLLSDVILNTETLTRHTNDLEILSYNTLRVRTQKNVQVQDSTCGHPGESRGWLQHDLYRDVWEDI